MQYISTCYHTLLNQLKSGRYALPDSFHLAPTSPRPHSFFPLQSSPKYFFNLNFKLPLSCSLFPHFSSHTQPSREAQMFAELESLLLAAAASPAAEGCGGKAKRNLHALAKTRHSKPGHINMWGYAPATRRPPVYGVENVRVTTSSFSSYQDETCTV